MDFTDTKSYHNLISEITALGYPKELGYMIAKNLYSEKMMDRMTAYLKYEKPRSDEAIVDEMLAIMSDRKKWINKKESEQANAVYNEYLETKRNNENK